MQHTYKYATQSHLLQGPAPKLALATADTGGERYPYLFEGRVLQPRLIANLLTSVHIIVGTRFYTPPGMNGRPSLQSDPVVTSGGYFASKAFRPVVAPTSAPTCCRNLMTAT